MKILWIGVGLGPEIREELIKRKGGLISGYVSQQNLMDGIDALDIDMDSINSMDLGNLIKNVKREEWSRNGKSNDVSVSYEYVKYFDMLSRQRALVKEAGAWAEKNRNRNDIIVFVYSMHTPFLKAALEVKKRIPTAKICNIVLDLPQYMSLSMSPVKKILKKLDWLRIKQCMKKTDLYVLYTKTMADYLKLQDGKWMVMEGSYDSGIVPETVKKDGDKTIIMHSGKLDLKYGIIELLDAMKYLDDKYELWLTGNMDRDSAVFIRERAESDSRIKFLGYLPSRQELINKQAQATMLISPRKDSEESSKYCFPSKLFEYMASGNPVISCRLDGIPDEYFDYLIELPQATAESIADTIRKVSEMPLSEREELGKKAKDFVLTRKNKYVQAKKMIEFVKN